MTHQELDVPLPRYHRLPHNQPQIKSTMKFNLLALSTVAALGGTDAFLLSPQQPRLSSSALAGYGIGSWNKQKSSSSPSSGGSSAVATRNPWDDVNAANKVKKSDAFIESPTPAVKKSYGLGSWSKSASSGASHVQDSINRAAPPSAAGGCPFHANYDPIREELKLLLDNPSWDDGSLAPIFIRLAWHSSGTYEASSGTGGSNGAGMRFQNEAADPENAGLNVARAFLEPVKRKFPEISYSGEYRY